MLYEVITQGRKSQSAGLAPREAGHAAFGEAAEVDRPQGLFGQGQVVRAFALPVADVRMAAGQRCLQHAGVEHVITSYSIHYTKLYEVLDWRDGRPILLRDIARIDLAMVDSTNVLHQNGGASIAIFVIPESGVNVYEVMGGLKAVVADLQANELAQAGLEMYLV